MFAPLARRDQRGKGATYVRGLLLDGRRKSMQPVALQYSGTLGKVGNCQVGVSICAVTDTASCPLSWRLFLPERWDDAVAATPEAAAAVRERRERAGIPAEARHREKWRLALDMVDELAGWGLAPPVVVADAGYGDIAAFRDGLSARGRAWVVQVQGGLSAHAEDAVPAGAHLGPGAAVPTALPQHPGRAARAR